MTFGDFLTAITPFNFISKNTNTDAWLAERKPTWLALADPDGSGSIDFAEFVFFLTILQTPLVDYQKKFMKAKNKCKKKDITLMLREFRTRAFGNKKVNKTTIDGGIIAASDQDFWNTNQRFVDAMMGGRETMTFQEFAEYRQTLREGVLEYEFQTFQPEADGTIDMEKFLKMIVVCLSKKQQEKYMKHACNVASKYPNIRVSLQQFILVLHYLDRLESLRKAVEKVRYMDLEQFQEHVEDFNHHRPFLRKGDYNITPEMSEALFMVLDVDGSGELEPEEITEVLGARMLIGGQTVKNK